MSRQLADVVPAALDEPEPVDVFDELVEELFEDELVEDELVEDELVEDELAELVDVVDWRTGVVDETELRPVPLELCWVETWALLARAGTDAAKPAVTAAPTPRAENA